MGEENGYKEMPAEKSSRSLTRQATGKRNGADYLPDFVDNRPLAIAQKKQIDSIYAQPFSPFPEGRADKEPMGLAAVRGNVLQQQAAPFSGRIGGVPVVQRQPFKSFAQATPLGLVDDANAFFGDGYTHYKKVLNVDDRVAAFKSIAEVGGAVGEQVRILLNMPNIDWGQGAGQNVLNPFVFTPQIKVKNKDAIQVSYMYDHDHYSYVVKTEEGNRKGIMEKMLEANPPDYGVYEQAHANIGNKKILFHTLAKNGKNPAKGSLDAYTKLAGEGARFMCVRSHIANITDNTIFYADTNWKDPNRALIYGITFQDLWGKWSKKFDKKFNIDNAEVKNVLMTNSYKVEDEIQVDRDYDVRLGRAAKVDDRVIGLQPTGTPQLV